MEQSDKKLLKNSTLNTIDAIVGANPYLAIAWGLAKGLLFNGLVMRQDRVLEFVEFIIGKPGIFTQDLMKTEEFQDGFVYCIEQYIRERNKDKRIIAQKIFLGFASSEDKQEFELERYLNVLGLLGPENLEHLGRLSPKDAVIHSSYAMGLEENYQYLNDLVSLGLVYVDYSEERRDEKIQGVGVEYKVTRFGHKFIYFLTR